MLSPRVFTIVGRVFRGLRFIAIWPLETRIFRCALPNWATLPQGEGRRANFQIPSRGMSIFDRLLGRRPDPTKDWPLEPPMPAGFDLARRAFGSLAFGDRLESAR